MRKIIIALLIIPLFVACNQKELKQLREQNAQLILSTQEKDASINEFIETLNTIEENLAIIKEKEKIIAVSAEESADKSQKEKITNDILLINNLIKQNRRDLKDLDKKLKDSRYSTSKLRKMVTRLEEQLAEREAEVAILNDNVTELNTQLSDLNSKVFELSASVDTLTIDNERKAKTIEEQSSDLNSVYYIFGSKSELRSKQITTPSGGFLGIGVTEKINKDINYDRFTKIDMTKTDTIPVSGGRISMVTNHPDGSYKINKTNNKVDNITIIDPKEFWKVSKYLVISVK